MTDFLTIDDDDDTIVAALAEASVPALLATLVHLTGDTSVLRPEFRPRADKLRERRVGLTQENYESLLEVAAATVASYQHEPRPLPDFAVPIKENLALPANGLFLQRIVRSIEILTRIFYLTRL